MNGSFLIPIEAVSAPSRTSPYMSNVLGGFAVTAASSLGRRTFFMMLIRLGTNRTQRGLSGTLLAPTGVIVFLPLFPLPSPLSH